jgi:glycerol-3-phosphate acyltransferase PlsY
MKSFIFFAALAFLSGATPTAYWTARRLRGIDIREHGSGNAGATNVTRVLGKGPGYFVFAVDFLKGFLPVLIYRFSYSFPTELQLLGIGVFAVLGHVFTPWLGFRGGKGVATGAGILAAAVPLNFALATVLWILCFLTTRTVSISSLAAALALPVSGVVLRQPTALIAGLGALFLFVLWTHRSNLARLLQKKENRF